VGREREGGRGDADLLATRCIATPAESRTLAAVATAITAAVTVATTALAALKAAWSVVLAAGRSATNRQGKLSDTIHQRSYSTVPYFELTLT